MCSWCASDGAIDGVLRSADEEKLAMFAGIVAAWSA